MDISNPAKISLWICCLWSSLDPALMLCKAGYYVCWFRASNRGILGRLMSDDVCAWPSTTCLELQVIHSLWLTGLSLGAHGKDQTARQGLDFSAPDAGAGW